MNLFDQNEPPQLDQSKNYLDELVGEGKKFKTVEDLARGKAEADLYIQTLNRRSDELREDYLELREQANAQSLDRSAQARLEELLAMETRRPPQVPVETLERKPQFDPSELPSLIAAEIKRDKATEKATSNFNTVQNKLKEQFGKDYQSVLQEKMNDLDLTLEDVNSLARKSPNAFFNTLGLNQSQESFMSPPRSSQSAGFNPQTKEKRTWAYYEKLRKADPKLYYNSKIANQMHDDAVALGTEFQDGDFHA